MDFNLLVALIVIPLIVVIFLVVRASRQMKRAEDEPTPPGPLDSQIDDRPE